MIWGTAGLATAFVILSALFLWFLIKAKLRLSIRFIIIPIIIWYGLILYETPGKLMGFPLSINVIEQMPEGSVVLYIKIVEPDYKSPGCFYFYVVHPQGIQKEKSFLDVINPKKIFGFDDTNVPISYKLKYDRKLHEQMIKAGKTMKRGNVMKISHGKGKGEKGDDKEGKGRSEYRSPFKILNPHELLPKEK